MKIADKLESCDKNFFHEITIRAVCVKRKPIEDIKKIQNLLARSKKLSNQINYEYSDGEGGKTDGVQEIIRQVCFKIAGNGLQICDGRD